MLNIYKWHRSRNFSTTRISRSTVLGIGCTIVAIYVGMLGIGCRVAMYFGMVVIMAQIYIISIQYSPVLCRYMCITLGKLSQCSGTEMWNWTSHDAKNMGPDCNKHIIFKLPKQNLIFSIKNFLVSMVAERSPIKVFTVLNFHVSAKATN